MKLIKPVTVTDSILLSSTVPENDYAEWSSGTTYSIGDRVIVVSVHKVYESLISSNTANNPTTDNGTKWLDLGATNRWKAFDKKIGDPVTQITSAEYVLNDPNSSITAVALFGLQGISANVTVTDNIDGEVYNETIGLLDNKNIIDWYTYFFEEQTQLQEALFLNIPPYVGSDVQITVTNTTGQDVKIGQIVSGFFSEIGLTTYGTSVSIEDFSRKETDAFGNFIVVERAFAQLVDYNVSYPTQNTRKIQSTLAQYRATPIVYIGSEDTSYGTVVYGFYRRFDLTLETPSYSLGAIEVEGLT
jgi:hypothetical protein